MVALGHATVGSNRLDAAKAFYDALLSSADITPLLEHPSGGRIYETKQAACPPSMPHSSPW